MEKFTFNGRNLDQDQADMAKLMASQIILEEQERWGRGGEQTSPAYMQIHSCSAGCTSNNLSATSLDLPFI